MADGELRAVERERDEALNNFEETYADLAQARYELKQVRSDLVMEQAALAASQQDLNRVEAERDAADAQAERLRGFWRECSRDREHSRAELASARQELALLRRRETLHVEHWRGLLLALGLDPDGSVPLLMAAQDVVRERDQLRAELDGLRAAALPPNRPPCPMGPSCQTDHLGGNRG